MIPIPTQYYPLLEEEMEKTGIFSYTELMGRILEEHFKGKKPKAEKAVKQKGEFV